MLLLFLLLLLVAQQVRTQGVPTLCSQQLHNYYVAAGMDPSVPVEPVITFVTGTLTGGVPYVTATLNFQAVARDYQFNISNNTIPTPWVSYMSFDVPCCATSITMTCTNFSQFAMAKMCVNIIDYDLGSPSQVAGRFFVYANQTAPCNGQVNITFTNTYLYPTQEVANYTYDAFGITNYTLLTLDQAEFNYRFSDCQYSTGSNLTEAIIQPQFVCIEAQIGCNVTCPTTQPKRQVIPIPRYACYNNNTFIGNVSQNDEYMIWFVYNMQQPNTIEGVFRLTFASPTLLGLYYDNLYDPFQLVICQFANIQLFYQLLLLEGLLPTQDPCILQPLKPSTRREFQENHTDFSYVMLLNAPNGLGGFTTTVVFPAYSASSDPVIEIIPCICGFSMDCLPDGTVAVNDIDHHIFINNQRPVPGFFGGSSTTIPQGTLNITVNGNLSTDRDFSPHPYLLYYWKAYNITNYTQAPVTGTPMFTFQNATNVETLIFTQDLLPGLYVAIMYVSDGQDVTFGLYNFTILANIITAVAPNDFAVALIPCTNVIPSTCIPLNASLSFETANLTLFYNWSEVTGWNLWPATFSIPCNDYVSGLFNYTSVVACFIPPFLGLYQFNVTVYDNISASSTDTVFVNVVPEGAPLVVPNITINPFPSAPLRTDPPINRPVIPFPNETGPPISDAPFAPAPTQNTSVPTVFPVYPPMTPSQLISMFAFLIAALIVMVIFFGLWIAMMPQNEYNYLDRIRYFTRDNTQQQ